MKKFKKVIAVVLCALVIGATFVGCTETSKRTWKSLQSDFAGGLDRTVVVYTLTGEEIARYEGRLDIEVTDGGKVLFDLDGKRYIYYNCTIEVIEN